MKGNTVNLGLLILTHLEALCGDEEGREEGKGEIFLNRHCQILHMLSQNVPKTFGGWASPGPPGSLSLPRPLSRNGRPGRGKPLNNFNRSKACFTAGKERKGTGKGNCKMCSKP